MTYFKIAKKSDIPNGSMKHFEFEGNEYLVTNIEGRFYAVDNRCSHLGAQLSQGELNGRIVVCPKHHNSFDVITGKAQTLHGYDIRVFSVKIEGEDLFIDD
jgi:3-phenylpropionate/trans-cinnamate dioxygenase ferredoxin component